MSEGAPAIEQGGSDVARASVQRQPSAWNIANYLTVLRLLLVPVFVAILFVDDGQSA